MKNQLFISLLILLMGVASGYSQKNTFTQITVQSSVQCDMCRQKVIKSLYAHKKEGIKNVQVNLTTKQIIVRYDTTKTDADAIRTWISQLGYKADEIAPEPDAYANLPNCCK